MSRPIAKRSTVVLAAAITLAAAVTAGAAAITVTLNLQGGYGNRTLKACALTHHYTLFHRGRAIGVNGVVSPAPSGAFRVKLKVKRCVRGRFRAVWVGNAQVRPDGTFQGTVPPRRVGYFFARAYYYVGTTTVKSDKQYFKSS
jgi:hypothetical protein